MDGTTATTKKKGTNNIQSRSGRCWTNERHLRFLNSIEASFVRAMFESFGRSDLPLDRHIPDSFESTQDLPNLRRRRCSDVEEQNIRATKKNKILLSNDQVVPQPEVRRDNEDDRDNVDACT